MSEPATLFRVGKQDASKRLDRFLHERIPGLSRTRIQRAIRERVSLSWGIRPRASTPVRPGGEVHIGYRPLAETLIEVDLPVLARGVGWLAVDKPSGIPVHPVNRVRENSLIRMLRRQEQQESLRLVHRLDRETTGVLLVASDHETASALSSAFMRGRVHKEYLALVRGVVQADRGQIDLAIGEDERSAILVRRRAGGAGKPAHTTWRIEQRFETTTLVRLFPGTGRRHQLRVHLAAIGHPVLGDLLYGRSDQAYLDLVRGGRDVRGEEGGPARQLLHCARVAFVDPGRGVETEVRAGLPADFVRFFC